MKYTTTILLAVTILFSGCAKEVILPTYTIPKYKVKSFKAIAIPVKRTATHSTYLTTDINRVKRNSFQQRKYIKVLTRVIDSIKIQIGTNNVSK